MNIVVKKGWRRFLSASSAATTSDIVKGEYSSEVFSRFFFAFSFLCCLSFFYDGNSANSTLPSARQSENNRSRVMKTERRVLWNGIDMFCYCACYVTLCSYQQLRKCASINRKWPLKDFSYSYLSFSCFQMILTMMQNQQHRSWYRSVKTI